MYSTQSSADAARRDGILRAAWALPVLAALFYEVGTAALACLCLALFALSLLSRWRAARANECSVVHVRADGLSLFIDGVERRVALEDLEQVEVETRTVERNIADKVVGATVVSMSVLPASDEARVVLVLGPGESKRRVALVHTFAPSTQVLEQMAKLRVFLRRHGWLPVDERAR